MGKRQERLAGIDCRAVGCGGTTVDFYVRADGSSIEAVWTNENCPYSRNDEVDDRYAAHDGHNVSQLSWDSILAMVRHVPSPRRDEFIEVLRRKARTPKP